PRLMTRPDPLGRLLEQLQRLPGMGAKSGPGLGVHILQPPREDADDLLAALRQVQDRFTYCSVCSKLPDVDPCFFCTHPGRDTRVICVVEEPENLTALGSTRDLKGLFN